MMNNTHPFNGPFSGTTQVNRCQKGKTNLDFTEAKDSEWQLHQLGHMQVCTSLQTDNHASTPPLSFLQAGCPSCRPTNSVKALKAIHSWWIKITNIAAVEFKRHSPGDAGERTDAGVSEAVRHQVWRRGWPATVPHQDCRAAGFCTARLGMLVLAPDSQRLAAISHQTLGQAPLDESDWT